MIDSLIPKTFISIRKQIIPIDTARPRGRFFQYRPEVAQVRGNSIDRYGHGCDVAQHQCPAGDKTARSLKASRAYEPILHPQAIIARAFSVGESVKDIDESGNS